MSRLLPALLLLLALAATACGTATGSPAVAATVNGSQIPMSAVEDAFDELARTEFYDQQVQAVGELEAERAAVANILSALIQRELLVGAAEERGVPLPTQEARDAQLEEIAASSGADVEAFRERLAAEQGLVAAQIDALLTAGLLEQAISEEIAAGAEVDEAAIQAAYEQQYLAQPTAYAIFGDDEAVVADLAAQVQSLGEDVAAIDDLGAELGADPEGPQIIPAPPAEQLGPDLGAVLSSLEAGVASTPLDAGGGVFVSLYLINAPDLEDVRDLVEEQAAQLAAQTAVDEAINDVRFNADIVVNPRFGSYDPLAQTVTASDPLGALEPVGGAPAEGEGDPLGLPPGGAPPVGEGDPAAPAGQGAPADPDAPAAPADPDAPAAPADPGQ